MIELIPRGQIRQVCQDSSIGLIACWLQEIDSDVMGLASSSYFRSYRIIEEVLEIEDQSLSKHLPL